LLAEKNLKYTKSRQSCSWKDYSAVINQKKSKRRQCWNIKHKVQKYDYADKLRCKAAKTHKS